MRLFASLSALLATCVFASPVTIPLQKLLRPGAYLEGSPAADRARAAFLQGRTSSGPTTVPAINLAYVQYTVTVGIGNPPIYYNLVIDTGSSNTFCIDYVRTNTSIPTGQDVNVTYGTAYFSGIEYLDQITLAPNLVITNQSIGDALSDSGFQGVQGILGVGPVGLTTGTLSPNTSATIPTVMNNLVSQGLIENQVLGVYFAPPTKYNDTNGALTYGGVNSSLFEGKVTYTPTTETYPASAYFGIDIKSSSYGNLSVIPATTPAVVDTGTTLILLADDFFATYVDAIPDATLDLKTGLVEIPYSSVEQMQPLIFWIGGKKYVMDVTAQLVPEDENTAWGGVSGKRYGVVNTLGTPSGLGLDVIFGQKFLERYYTVFDMDARRVGFARTNNTFTIRI